MAFRFDGSGSLRITTTQDTDEIMIAGIAERHSSLSAEQIFAAFLSSSSSAYKTAGGSLTDDGQVSGLMYDDADAAIGRITNWSGGADFASIADGTLFSFAVIQYKKSGTTPTFKYAIRPYPTGTLYTAETSPGANLGDWTNTKVYIGASSGNGSPCRMRISQIVLRTPEPADEDIEAYFDSHHLTGSDIWSSISGIGKANLAAALVDESGNGNNWTSNGSGISLDDSNNPTSNPTISGILVMPSSGTVGGETPTAPTAPSSLAATVLNSDTVQLNWTDNSDDEVEFVAQMRMYSSGAWGNWGDVQSVVANATSMTVGGLTPATPYQFRVYAINAAGASSLSNTVDATTKRLYVKVYVEAAAAGKSGISVAMWRPATGGNLHGQSIPLSNNTGLTFNTLTEVDPADSVTKAVLEIEMTQPAPESGSTPVPIRNGDSLMVVVTRPSEGKWTQIIPDAKVVEA